MKIFIDADGCPVVDITVKICKENGIECIIVTDTSHVFNKPNATTLTVSKGADSVDFALVNMLSKGDIAVTQDYGLAAMCLSKQAFPISQNGMIYNDFNIGSLLQARYTAKKLRQSGKHHLKGPGKRTPQQDKDYEKSLQALITQLNGNG
ncbi:MAG TPA: YaiI/YqxD family protein [Clostridiales bacterium]|nr:YaiI/YqxD family protein [Clostridiales bacterium]